MMASLTLSRRSFHALTVVEGKLKKRFVFACINRISFAFRRLYVSRPCTRGSKRFLM